MPRDGSGASDNAVEAGEHIIHGAGANAPATSTVDRSFKAAALPDKEEGDALDGMNASGGGSSAAHIGDVGSGKGPKDPASDDGIKKS